MWPVDALARPTPSRRPSCCATCSVCPVRQAASWYPRSNTVKHRYNIELLLIISNL
nr:MAG TPA: hypothetical protein [Caudoviricetes sp.]